MRVLHAERLEDARPEKFIERFARNDLYEVTKDIDTKAVLVALTGIEEQWQTPGGGALRGRDGGEERGARGGVVSARGGRGGAGANSVPAPHNPANPTPPRGVCHCS